MQSKPFRFGPQNMPNTVTDILNPGTLTGGVVTIDGSPVTFGTAPYVGLMVMLRHIRIVNTGVTALTFSLYISPSSGGFAVGTEFMGAGFSVAANDYIDWYGAVPIKYTDFLTGISSAATGLTIEGEGEIGVM